MRACSKIERCHTVEPYFEESLHSAVRTSISSALRSRCARQGTAPSAAALTSAKPRSCSLISSAGLWRMAMSPQSEPSPIS
eukprot:CAMPEP_0182547220 /NCGR_PEP_ID=MMETSP1323-20130603/37151_1 /TAXON_ID=236787 /ORGANISM="Florenciella parvula, Strain RCC1693" /LENGTH=80 /DNA_ID=CAMNT_0024758509 /DNA_START=336 /DNA_END=578 /DNA_ORIENTATION=+